MTEPLKRTPLYEEHVALGGRMVPFAGWEMPVQYAGVTKEHLAVRNAAGLFDVSHMGEIALTGSDPLRVVNRLITNDASKLTDGGALYTCACNERGTILDDLIVYRIVPGRWLVVCNAGNRDKMVAHFQAAATQSCAIADASDDTALIALQGPKAMAIAQKAGPDGQALAELQTFAHRPCKLCGVSTMVARTGYTGEDGVEIFCAAIDAVKLWRGLLAAGKDDGIAPCGLGARDTLRLEARLSLYGNDIDETTNPLEAGLGWTVKLDKPDFVGKAALVAVKSAGLTRKLVGFEMVGRGIARHGYPLLDCSPGSSRTSSREANNTAPDGSSRPGKTIGVCTSGSPSPTLGKNIGLGYAAVGHDAVGTKIQVDCRGKAVEAVVVATPFYKRAFYKRAR